MAEILKITTPLVNKSNQLNPVDRQHQDPARPFEMKDVQTVVRPMTQDDILKQNNTLIEKENSSNVLTTLLKDPAATVNFLKNIFVLQEMVQLLPAKNTTVTQEIEQMFQMLLIQPENIAGEMMKQEGNATVFRGELFDMLRSILAENPSQEMRLGVAALLKSISNIVGKKDAVAAVSNSLKFLSESLSPSKTLSDKLMSLSTAFRTADSSSEQFQQLKNEILDVMKEVEGSLLYTPKLEKVNAIMLYNLSRINNNPDFFREASTNLLLMLERSQRDEFASYVRQFRAGVGKSPEFESSQIMDILTEIIGKQASDTQMSAATSEKIEKIIYSLLSSPCHFTPLLHFVVPVEFDFLKSFAEIWINPNGGEDLRSEEPVKDCIHMLLVFDVQGIGQFEAEIYTFGKNLELSLLCPPAHIKVFSEAASRFAKCVADSPYYMSNIRVDKLERPRSLMEVFKSLPYKRTGVNVKV